MQEMGYRPPYLAVRVVIEAELFNVFVTVVILRPLWECPYPAGKRLLMMPALLAGLSGDDIIPNRGAWGGGTSKVS
jgi:hypothetical protein